MAQSVAAFFFFPALFHRAPFGSRSCCALRVARPRACEDELQFTLPAGAPPNLLAPPAGSPARFAAPPSPAVAPAKAGCAGVLPFQIGRAEKTFTTYRACMEGRGNMCTIELNCVEQPLPSAVASNEQKSFMVILQPSATVTEAVAKLSELLDAETPGEQATALVLRSAGTASGMQRLDSECTLWDYGITSNTDVYFE